MREFEQSAIGSKLKRDRTELAISVRSMLAKALQSNEYL